MLKVPKAKVASAIRTIASLVEIEPWLKIRMFILSPFIRYIISNNIRPVGDKTYLTGFLLPAKQAFCIA